MRRIKTFHAVVGYNSECQRVYGTRKKRVAPLLPMIVSLDVHGIVAMVEQIYYLHLINVQTSRKAMEMRLIFCLCLHLLIPGEIHAIYTEERG